jgi:hypothetical protein
VYVSIRTRTDPLFNRVGADLWHHLHLQAPDAVLGVTTAVPLPGGQARVRVPPGTQPGSVLRVAGRGLPRYDGDGRGNLQLTVILDIPRKLNPSQRQLYEQLRAATRSPAGESRKSEVARADHQIAATPGARDTTRSLFNFASVLLLIAGAANVVGGIAVISASDLFFGGTQHLPGPSVWGWILIILGVLELLGAAAAWLGRRASHRGDHRGTRTAARHDG